MLWIAFNKYQIKFSPVICNWMYPTIQICSVLPYAITCPTFFFCSCRCISSYPSDWTEGWRQGVCQQHHLRAEWPKFRSYWVLCSFLHTADNHGDYLLSDDSCPSPTSSDVTARPHWGTAWNKPKFLEMLQDEHRWRELCKPEPRFEPTTKEEDRKTA